MAGMARQMPVYGMMDYTGQMSMVPPPFAGALAPENLPHVPGLPPPPPLVPAPAPPAQPAPPKEAMEVHRPEMASANIARKISLRDDTTAAPKPHTATLPMKPSTGVIKFKMKKRFEEDESEDKPPAAQAVPRPVLRKLQEQQPTPRKILDDAAEEKKEKEKEKGRDKGEEDTGSRRRHRRDENDVDRRRRRDDEKDSRPPRRRGEEDEKKDEDEPKRRDDRDDREEREEKERRRRGDDDDRWKRGDEDHERRRRSEREDKEGREPEKERRRRGEEVEHERERRKRDDDDYGKERRRGYDDERRRRDDDERDRRRDDDERDRRRDDDRRKRRGDDDDRDRRRRRSDGDEDRRHRKKDDEGTHDRRRREERTTKDDEGSRQQRRRERSTDEDRGPKQRRRDDEDYRRGRRPRDEQDEQPPKKSRTELGTEPSKPAKKDKKAAAEERFAGDDDVQIIDRAPVRLPNLTELMMQEERERAMRKKLAEKQREEEQRQKEMADADLIKELEEDTRTTKPSEKRLPETTTPHEPPRGKGKDETMKEDPDDDAIDTLQQIFDTPTTSVQPDIGDLEKLFDDIIAGTGITSTSGDTGASLLSETRSGAKAQERVRSKSPVRKEEREAPVPSQEQPKVPKKHKEDKEDKEDTAHHPVPAAAPVPVVQPPEAEPPVEEPSEPVAQPAAVCASLIAVVVAWNECYEHHQRLAEKALASMVHQQEQLEAEVRVLRMQMELLKEKQRLEAELGVLSAPRSEFEREIKANAEKKVQEVVAQQQQLPTDLPKATGMDLEIRKIEEGAKAQLARDDERFKKLLKEAKDNEERTRSVQEKLLETLEEKKKELTLTLAKAKEEEEARKARIPPPPPILDIDIRTHPFEGAKVGEKLTKAFAKIIQSSLTQSVVAKVQKYAKEHHEHFFWMHDAWKRTLEACENNKQRKSMWYLYGAFVTLRELQDPLVRAVWEMHLPTLVERYMDFVNDQEVSKKYQKLLVSWLTKRVTSRLTLRDCYLRAVQACNKRGVQLDIPELSQLVRDAKGKPESA
eukprot:Sspe_Gene.34786::Locus_16889_Transcript_1_1_Confidence_1.000_Length_3285::g.34786::m.34786